MLVLVNLSVHLKTYMAKNSIHSEFQDFCIEKSDGLINIKDDLNDEKHTVNLKNWMLKIS